MGTMLWVMLATFGVLMDIAGTILESMLATLGVMLVTLGASLGARERSGSPMWAP